MNVWLDSANLLPECRLARFEKEQAKQQYYQRRSKPAYVSQTKTRQRRLSDLGIDANWIKSCLALPRPPMIRCTFTRRLTTNDRAKVALSN